MSCLEGTKIKKKCLEAAATNIVGISKSTIFFPSSLSPPAVLWREGFYRQSLQDPIGRDTYTLYSSETDPNPRDREKQWRQVTLKRQDRKRGEKNIDKGV